MHLKPVVGNNVTEASFRGILIWDNVFDSSVVDLREIASFGGEVLQLFPSFGFCLFYKAWSSVCNISGLRSIWNECFQSQYVPGQG